MSLTDLTDPDAVRRAVAEHDQLGRDRFLALYRFSPARAYFLELGGRLYDSKAVVAAAHGYQHPSAGPLRADEFSGGQRTVQRKLEQLGFRVAVQEPDAVEIASTGEDDAVTAERERRLQLWRLVSEANEDRLTPGWLNELRVFYGGRGVWVHQERTRGIGGARKGVTVGLLHTGSSYADDLSETGVLYHYPETSVPGRDQSEIQATKAAGRMRLPVFVVSYPRRKAPTRRVHLGWVENWDDQARQFLVTFAERPQDDDLVDHEEQFTATGARGAAKTLQVVRPHQQRFKFQVLKRYGGACALCDLALPELLEAAHLVPKGCNGVDDPRNGLVLCPTHHRAFDAGFIGIEPETTTIHFWGGMEQGSRLKVTRSTLRHLPRAPHREALKWRWERWCSGRRADIAEPDCIDEVLTK